MAGTRGADDVDALAQVRGCGHLLPVGLGERHAMFLQHRRHQQHVGAFLVGPQGEVIAHPFLQDARRKGPEALAELDLQVHRGLHRGVARVADDAARPQRPRPKLHPALEPADDLAFGHHLRDALQQVALVFANR